ncbi:MAG TPA: DUF438 domain-containing protein [Coriobacteriia bacterium]|nr:DUF438 domain-containing protein [Coriobacteriia bacterium]
MTITAETTIHQLLEAYPYLRPWLVSYAPDFKKLDNPVLYNTMARVATLEAAASMGEVPVEKLLDDIRTQVAQHEIAAEETAGIGAAPAEGADRRQELLKQIIRQLHDGAPVEVVKAEFDQLVSEVDSAEIARMEQALIAEGMPIEEVQRLCDVHVTVFKEALEEKPDAEVAEGHPIDNYRRENEVVGELTAAVRSSAQILSAATDDETRHAAVDAIGLELERLAQVEIHYLRKENQLFPVLEKHGVEGPTKVMWGLDDDIRGRIKAARTLLAAGDLSSVTKMLPELLGMIDDMAYKEEKILLPTALQVVTETEWAEMAAGDSEIGYAWIEGSAGIAAAAAAAVTPQAEGPMLLPLPTGALSLDQLDVMFRALPFDLSFVDEHDTVRFYTEGLRVFPRSPAAIGRQVRNCHPPKSVDKVEQILAEFKAGTKDVAEFWIQMGPKFVHIRYYAMRDADGTYKGCLEVVQDATHVRALEGERRIVDW